MVRSLLLQWYDERISMNRHYPLLYGLLVSFGFDPKKIVFALKGLPHYLKNLKTLKRQEKYANHKFVFGRPNLCLDDMFLESGDAKGHYFYQDWLVARRIFENNPEVHIDVGSRIDGFVVHVATFRSIRVFDIRPLEINIPTIQFMQGDLVSGIDNELVDCCDSLSCLHTVEHFGLGRYGDPVQYNGHVMGLNNLYLLLKKNGKFYFSVPIGPERIEYNAHRVFSLKYLLELFNGKFQIDHFSLVDDDGQLHENIPLTKEKISNNFGCYYGCGIFELTKF